MKDDDENRLSQETMQELDDAAWRYINAVKDALKKHTDEELRAFACEVEQRSCAIDFDGYARCAARFEVVAREIFKKAERSMALSGSSGMYCVFHDCDMKDCKELHDDD